MKFNDIIVRSFILSTEEQKPASGVEQNQASLRRGRRARRAAPALVEMAGLGGVALLSTLAARWVKDRLPQSRVAAAIAAFLAALSGTGGSTSRNPVSPQNRISARQMAPLAANSAATAMAAG